MTYYRDVALVNEPADVGPDEDGRALFSFDVLVTRRQSSEPELELLTELAAADVGVLGTTLFGSTMADVPHRESPGEDVVPFVHLRATGGPGPEGTHNDGALAYRRSTVHVEAHSDTTAGARLLAEQALAALVAIRSREVTT